MKDELPKPSGHTVGRSVPGSCCPHKNPHMKKTIGVYFLFLPDIEPESRGHADSLLKGAERVTNSCCF